MTRRRNAQRPRNNGQGGSQVLRDARRDVMNTLRPYLSELRRAKQTARRDTNQQVTQLGNVNTALQSQLSGLAQPFQDQLSGIGSDLSSQIAGLAPMMTQSVGAVPEAERAAGQNLVGVTGAGGLEQISSARTRGAAYNTSSQRQGAIEQKVDTRNALADLAGFNTDIASRRMDIMSGAPAQIRQRADELEQMSFDRRMALASLALNRSQFGLQQSQYASDQASQAAIDRVMAQIAGNPAALREFLGLTGGP